MNEVELLKRAWAAVEASGVPDSLHVRAFELAVEHLRGASAASPEAPTTPPGIPASNSQASGRTSAEEDSYARLASVTSTAVSAIRKCVQIDEDTVVVIAPGYRLGGSKSEKARTAAALIAGAEHGVRGTDPVSFEPIKAATRKAGAYDSGNFMKSMELVQGFTKTTNGLMADHGWETAFAEAVGKASGTSITPEATDAR